MSFLYLSWLTKILQLVFTQSLKRSHGFCGQLNSLFFRAVKVNIYLLLCIVLRISFKGKLLGQTAVAHLGAPSLAIFLQHAHRAVELKQMTKVLGECHCEMLALRQHLITYLNFSVLQYTSVLVHVIFDTVTTWKDFLILDSFLLMYILKNVLLHTVQAE